MEFFSSLHDQLTPPAKNILGVQMEFKVHIRKNSKKKTLNAIFKNNKKKFQMFFLHLDLFNEVRKGPNFFFLLVHV